MAVTGEEEQKWGRVLICGGTGWATNGRKDRPTDSGSDLNKPHILRSICHIKVVGIFSAPAANYAFVIDIHGIAHLFGKLPCPHLAPKTAGVVSETSPLKVSPRSVGLGKDVKWVGGTCGRSHLILLASDGTAWGCGNNVMGQIGLPPKQEVEQWTKITGPWNREVGTKIVQVSSGQTFSLFLTNTGQVYAAGSSESGQLGNGKTGERLLKGGKTGFDIESPPRLITSGISGKKIVKIASGNQHSLAMDETGCVWGWGFAGYSRLGLQDQKDRLIPTLIPDFAREKEITRAADIICGPTNSVIIDRQRMYWMAGKFKLTGDGSGGQPWTSFKIIHEMAGCKINMASCGGCTHFATTPNAAGGVMTIGFGQGCLYGELGLGADQGKSATKPTEIEPLRGINVIDVAAGAFATLFLAQPNEASSELDRWPERLDTTDICIVCNEDKGDDDSPLECERCDMPYHLGCLDPPLSDVPEGEWFCPECEKTMQLTAREEEDMVNSRSQSVSLTKPIEVDEDDEGSINGSTRVGKSGTPASKLGRGESGTPLSMKNGTPKLGGKRKIEDSSVNGSSKKSR